MTFMRKLMDLINIDNWYNCSNKIDSLKLDSKSLYINEDERRHYIYKGVPLKLHFDNSNGIIPDNLYQLYNGSLPKRKLEIISRDILSSVGVCSSSSDKLCAEALEYISSNHSRIDTCAYGASICIPPNNNNELFLISHGYHYAGASYRKDAIYWYNEYIKSGAVSDYIQSYILYEDYYSYDQRIKFVALSHSVLADLYASEEMFYDSNYEYFTSITIAPFLPSNYINISNNNIKQRNFNDAKNILQVAQKSLFYSIDKSFKMAIDNHIIACNEEIDLINHFVNIVIPTILKIVSDNPGILQKNLYRYFPDLDTMHLRWTCKRLSEENKIIRAKKGNSYSLYPIK